VQGLIVHYQETDTYGIEIPPERRREIDTRHVPAMLERIMALDARPLLEPRAPERRLIGCCRDFATLTCSMLRQRGISTRVRWGFSTYFQPGFNCDHVICEHWNGDRWVLVDPEMDDLHRQMNNLRFDPLDLPRDRFLLAGEPWRRCRSGDADPERFGVDDETRGMWSIQSSLIHDVAALNRMELLCWDCWGLADIPPGGEATGEEVALLDRLASLSLGDDNAILELRSIYAESPQLRPDGTVNSYSPNGRYQVDLSG
jgi:hypothetical protein